jgi:DNA polymerase III subunit gamma/tau
MAWQSLYRRYRSRRWSEVKGQDHVVTALRNAVRDGRVAHAYLFSGPRGTGKTTSARILAKALNCENVQDGEPCLVCDSCVAIEAGTSYDLHELDAASNNGVEAMRDLISRAALGTPGRTKVYILDEVHMLSPGASNALLKTLEDPPDHVVFALATTDPHKVLNTIKSRTQHFELHLIPADVLEAHVRWVAADAGLDVDDEIIAHVIRVGGGSARDTLSALDQVLAAGGIDERAADTGALLTGLLERDPGAVLAAVHHGVSSGRDPRVLAEGLVHRLRDAFLSSVGVTLDHLPAADRERTADLAAQVERPFLTRALEVLGEAMVDMRQSPDPRITLETALVRLADVRSDTSIAALVDRIDRLERQLAAGGPAAPAAPQPVPAGPAQAARERLAAKAPEPASPERPRGAQVDAGSPSIPSRDELTLAWGDSILGKLSGAAKARFAAGRFVDVADDAAVFALPNEMHRSRCEEVRDAVEGALAAHFGRPVPLRLTVEAPAAPAAAGPVAEQAVDLSELVDAPAEPARSLADRLTDAFPGAVVEETR